MSDSFTRASESPVSLDYNADCSYSVRNADSASEASSFVSLPPSVHCSSVPEAGDYIKLWQICKPFFAMHSESQANAAADSNMQTQQAGGPAHALAVEARRFNPHESSSISISSSIDESDVSSDTAIDENPRNLALAQQVVPPIPMQQQQQQLMIDHLRPKVVSDNTGSAGSNREGNKTETNSTESNSGDDGRIGRDNSGQSFVENDAQHETAHPSSGKQQQHQRQNSEDRFRLASRKRKRFHQRREFEEAGQFNSYFSSSSTDASDSSTAKYLQPAGRPITLDEALSFTHTARVVVLGTFPFTVVHANAAFYRLTGLISSNFIVNQPLSSLIRVPDDHLYNPTCSDSTQFMGEERNKQRNIDMGNTIQSILKNCGNAHVLPMYILASRTSLSHFNQNHVFRHEHHTSQEANDPKALDFISCYMSIRPVIRDQPGTKALKQRSNLNFKSSIYPTSCHNSNRHTEQIVGHYVIHLKLKEDGLSHKPVQQELTTEDIKIKSDTESCSSGTKAILTCA